MERPRILTCGVSVPGAVATGSGSPARLLKVPRDPVATAPGTDTERFFETKPLAAFS